MKPSTFEMDNKVMLCWDAEWKSLEDILNSAKTMQQMKDMDHDAIVNKGISSLWLMENAAASVVREVTGHISDKNEKITIVCGAGNNGGDGVACAYMLKDLGIHMKVYLCGKRDKMTEDELAMEHRLNERGESIIYLFSGELIDEAVLDDLKKDISSSSCCIDALFGVGISRVIKEPYSNIIEAINEAPFIVSCDIPSGINGDSGEVMGVAVKSDVTVTFTCIKKGLMNSEAAPYVGKLMVVPIGIPE